MDVAEPIPRSVDLVEGAALGGSGQRVGVRDLIERIRSAGKTILRVTPACLLLLSSELGAAEPGIEGDGRIAQARRTLSHTSSPKVHSGQAGQLQMLGRVDGALDEIERMIDEAYFRTALGMVDTRRERLNELSPIGALRPRRARLEVLAATAAIALDRRVDAMRSMRRALRADPSLTLDEQSTPPKVYALLRQARTGRTFRSKP